MTEEKDPTVNELDDSQNVEEVVDEVVEQEEATDSDVPTLEDYRSLEQKNKELYERAKKAEGTAKVLKQTPTLKSTEQAGLTREEVILYAKGYTDDEVATALKLATLNGENPLVVAESDDYFKAKVAERKKKEKSEQASLPASYGSGRVKADKPIGDMDRDEHIEHFNKVMGNI